MPGTDSGAQQSNVPNQLSSNSTDRTKSYAAMAQSDQFPKREQAIVIPNKEGVQLREYVCRVGEIIGPSNVRFASKISNGRVCIFLGSKEIAEDLVSKQTKVNIGGTELEIRLLITRHKRIILSNVCPSIPHIYIEEMIDKLKIRRTSPISFLRAGIPDQAYSHVQSFRRQMYVHPDDVLKLPASLPCTLDEMTTRIFISTDSLKCFVCNENGHIAINCPTAQNTNTESNGDSPNSVKDGATLTLQLDDIQNKTDEPEAQHDQEDSAEIENQTPTQNNTNHKRTRSIVTDSTVLSMENDNETNETNDTKFITPSSQKRPKKKSKKSETNSQNIEELLAPLETTLNQPNKLMNYVQFKNFIENTRGAKNPVTIAKDYCKNVTELTSLMQELYPLLEDRSIKSRFTRIINKLGKSESKEITGSSNNSQSSEDEFSAVE